MVHEWKVMVNVYSSSEKRKEIKKGSGTQLWIYTERWRDRKLCKGRGGCWISYRIRFAPYPLASPSLYAGTQEKFPCTNHRSRIVFIFACISIVSQSIPISLFNTEIVGVLKNTPELKTLLTGGRGSYIQCQKYRSLVETSTQWSNYG